MTESHNAALLDGTAVAARIVEKVTADAAALTAGGVTPCLATVLVGADPASVTYVRMKQNRSAKAGIGSWHVELPANITTATLVAALTELSQDPDVHGILLQHPVPAHIDERAAFEAIAPEKDVDGVTMHSFAAMAFGEPGFVSATPGGILRLLDEYGVELAGKHAVVVGRSPILGKPVGMMLLARDATVTYCHSRTADLASYTRQADILVAAVGRPAFITGEAIKPGAVVIDAGYNPGNIGDVDFASAVTKAGLITPVPGGVGPMTIAVLLEQTVAAATRQQGRR
ncbi:bifunctional 5,10-methylenetetrahydrofolate dehydrogenase/5,10-methenyltetrahydrofolate cyclohydrolase [Catenulispora sp. NF23]|uniref:Bifunctional protein FolD n=1 Tax=Catenulispora pinistramenti TaxID=2705254 RepID=A0ABS5KLU5_9ACTN|nr:bifunctional 5,10-methylenetetrahydrofolate dehydrogenase/5,10-methenyltetrahydrofolate cyclohydrolase [Catenulispora pinistramenti]MBS2531456.1 bifunctional 5,10-methylenetetrahydrofolate dehydrogenase/5,10-methenyltetrahydrofolate cyclohydrolase [Catenulispora pinistramenti]MBS2547007.1 bifunctional 5,10-methylenetetrahydrofolate dehydrogenase/5,10-methenyltetrahydrofolate cyclohydrolase [Catenulispora pinistramenti]